LCQAIAMVPPEWYTADINSLHKHLMYRLEYLRTLIQGEPLKSIHPMPRLIQ
jgi:hypothetical protein